MKKCVFFLLFVLFFTLSVSADIAEVGTSDLSIGKVRFPRPFIHDGKDYNKGVYKITLREKEGEIFFMVSNSENKLLFEEVAIVKPKKSRIGKRPFTLRRRILRGYEYFRIRVTKPDKLILGYFLLTKKIKKS